MKKQVLLLTLLVSVSATPSYGAARKFREWLGKLSFWGQRSTTRTVSKPAATRQEYQAVADATRPPSTPSQSAREDDPYHGFISLTIHEDAQTKMSGVTTPESEEPGEDDFNIPLTASIWFNDEESGGSDSESECEDEDGFTFLANIGDPYPEPGSRATRAQNGQELPTPRLNPLRIVHIDPRVLHAVLRQVEAEQTLARQLAPPPPFPMPKLRNVIDNLQAGPHNALAIIHTEAPDMLSRAQKQSADDLEEPLPPLALTFDDELIRQAEKQLRKNERQFIFADTPENSDDDTPETSEPDDDWRTRRPYLGTGGLLRTSAFEKFYGGQGRERLGYSVDEYCRRAADGHRSPISQSTTESDGTDWEDDYFAELPGSSGECDGPHTPITVHDVFPNIPSEFWSESDYEETRIPPAAPESLLRHARPRRRRIVPPGNLTMSEYNHHFPQLPYQRHPSFHMDQQTQLSPHTTLSRLDRTCLQLTGQSGRS